VLLGLAGLPIIQVGLVLSVHCRARPSGAAG
jgi:hypothetical protein